ncbi:hypothetical protein UlMin_006943, partial [Ulmus minor]
ASTFMAIEEEHGTSKNRKKESENRELDPIKDVHPTGDWIVEAENSNKKGPFDVLFLWKNLFVWACAIAVSLDPMFNYIPMINEDNKCIKMDNNLKIAALVLRSLTDLIYVVDIILKVAKVFSKLKELSWPWKGAELLKKALEIAPIWFLIVVDFLAILPIPQVVILVFFPKIEGSTSLDTRKYLNVILLAQYVPRVLRIYLSCNDLTCNPEGYNVWVRALFNFFLYILASHVFGAFWYFFSLQRETACWHQACGKDPRYCIPSSYNCDEIISRNITYLNLFCPIDPSNEKLFNFGIFLDALQSGVLGSTDFPQKFLQCFWWGLKNLSSLGQNLETSPYIWENAFAVSISIIGLILFLYLIGNLQVYMSTSAQTYIQMEFRKSELGEKKKQKEKDIESWTEKMGLPKVASSTIKEEIMKNAKYLLQENKEVNVETVFFILPKSLKKAIKRYLCLPILRKVKTLESMDKIVLEEIIEYLKPMIHNEHIDIIKEGEPITSTTFIMEGVVWTYRNQSISNDGNSLSPYHVHSSNGRERLGKGKFFGEELFDEWATGLKSLEEVPTWTKTVKSRLKVEAFVLTAKDLKIVVEKFPTHFKEHQLHEVIDGTPFEY